MEMSGGTSAFTTPKKCARRFCVAESIARASPEMLAARQRRADRNQERRRRLRDHAHGALLLFLYEQCPGGWP